VKQLLAVWIAAIVVALVAVGSCSIEHRTGALVCETQADCPSDRLCREGYCIFTGPIDAGVDSSKDGPPDALACPRECTSCDLEMMTCLIDCDKTTCTNANVPVKCPAGWDCTINCSTQNSCRNLDCTQGHSCTVTCKGVSSCRDAICGNDRPCDFTCTGEQSCRNVNCDASCGCDVRCEAALSCPVANDCPGDADGCSTFDNGCTTERLGCDLCLP